MGRHGGRLMRRITSVFLAGPDLWFPQGEALIAEKRELTETAGFIGVAGREGPLTEARSTEARNSELGAREIYADTLIRLRSCEAVIANLTPWRGVGCDPGTAFEVGFAAALGLPVFAYLNVASEDEADHLGRVEAYIGAELDAEGRWRDPDGCEIDDYGLPENPMLWAEVRRLMAVVTPDPFNDLTGFEACLQQLALYAD